ncbi:MAG: SIMPL domain-containing protein [Chloroflexota bacterium]
METQESPNYIRVTGSSATYIEPDIAVILFAVSRIKPHPREAFHEVREASQRVQAFFAEAPIEDAGASKVSLHKERELSRENVQILNYRARVDFRLVLRDLSQMEAILIGLVDTGIESIQSVDFQSSRTAEIQNNTRRQALGNAREKATIYCEAANVDLGGIFRIEDLSQEQAATHLRRGMYVGGTSAAPAFDPGSLVVKNSVAVTFRIHERSV